MQTLGLDMTDDSLKDSPKRVAKMYVNEIFWRTLPENKPEFLLLAINISTDRCW